MADPGRAESPWVRRFLSLVPPGGHVLDVACGAGRHVRLALDRGHRVTAVDRDLRGLAELRGDPRLTLLEADLERGGWPLPGRRFDGVVVTDYLWRPAFGDMVAAVGDGGVLIYETFGVGQEVIGRPRNQDFLLRSAELWRRLDGELRVVAYEEGVDPAPCPAVRQRVVAVRCSIDAPPVELP